MLLPRTDSSSIAPIRLLLLALLLIGFASACRDGETAETGARAPTSTPVTAATPAATTPAGPTLTSRPSPATAPPSPAPGVAAAGFLLRVGGTNGVTFAGTCESGTAQGGTASQPVSGTVPAQFELPGSRLRCTLRHQSGTGTLRVEVLRGGQVVNTSETSAGGEITIQLAFQ